MVKLKERIKNFISKREAAKLSRSSEGVIREALYKEYVESNQERILEGIFSKIKSSAGSGKSCCVCLLGSNWKYKDFIIWDVKSMGYKKTYVNINRAESIQIFIR